MCYVLVFGRGLVSFALQPRRYFGGRNTCTEMRWFRGPNEFGDSILLNSSVKSMFSGRWEGSFRAFNSRNKNH